MHSNYGGQESKTEFAVYDSDTFVTLKQSYNNAKFEKLSL